MSKKRHRGKEQLVIRVRMEAPPDYSDVMLEPETEAGMNAGTMTIDSILAQLASLKDNAGSFPHTPPEPDSDEIWLADIAALEAATAILSALQDEGIGDPEAVRDLLCDYELANQQLAEMTRKYGRSLSPRREGSAYVCPICGWRLPVSAAYCHHCGKRVEGMGYGKKV